MKQLAQLLPLETMNTLSTMTDRYRSAKPFPHIVIDDFFSQETIAELIADFPGPCDPGWLKYRAPAEKDKLQSTSELSMPPSIRELISALNSSTFVRFLEALTGIEGIIPDPHLHGGGMHQTLSGGHLKMHIDYNLHQKWRLERRLNFLLYLNKQWEESWGGALELWDSDRTTKKMTHCVLKAHPIANRVVIFSTTEDSWHGHPDALACPENVTRKSIALYYYTNERPNANIETFHNTIFKERPGEDFKYVTWKDAARDIIPPIVLKAVRRVKSARHN